MCVHPCVVLIVPDRLVATRIVRPAKQVYLVLGFRQLRIEGMLSLAMRSKTNRIDSSRREADVHPTASAGDLFCGHLNRSCLVSIGTFGLLPFESAVRWCEAGKVPIYTLLGLELVREYTCYSLARHEYAWRLAHCESEVALSAGRPWWQGHVQRAVDGMGSRASDRPET